jgi:hypothetical protein
MESKFLEAIRKLVEYSNREFLRSFQLRLEIKECNGNSNSINNSDNNIITTDVASLIPPFETIGFLEAKWLEVSKELVEYGNKNILGNFVLYLVMEEIRVEKYAKEATRGCILDIKKEAKEVHHLYNGSISSNQSWSRPRDKNGRFTSSSAITTATVAAANTTTDNSVTDNNDNNNNTDSGTVIIITTTIDSSGSIITKTGVLDYQRKSLYCIA